MAILDTDFAAEPTLTESGERICFSPAAPTCAPHDLQWLYERERARADAAEARCEELRWAEVAARSDAGSWKSRFKACRNKLDAAVEETKKLRREVRAGAPGLHREVARLRKELSQALAEPSAAATRARENRLGALEAENLQLRKTLQREEGHKETIRWQNGEIVRHVAELRRLRDQNETVRSLSAEVYRIRLTLEVSEHAKEKLTARLAKFRALGATLSRLPFDEAAHLRNVLRRSRRQKTTIDRLRKENARLRKAVTAAKAGREGAEARLARLRAARKTLSKKLSGMDAELRKVLRRSRRQKSAIKSLSRENGRLRKAVKGSQRRVETLETQLARLRSTGAVLSRKLFGRKSEQQDKPRSERKRGQQRGAPGHGRTQRPGLEERAEVHNPPPDACICACCGQPYAPNGVEESTLVEIEVKAHKRVISRPRLRRTCECASSPMEVSAPPAPRLFDDTLYGITVWTCFLYERYACFRPLNAVAAWLCDRGLAISPGTLADSVKRFLPLFEPIAKAILAHQNMATVRHADETSWRVQEFRREDRSSRAWLWTSVSSDAVYFHIDPSRSAEAALKLFAEALPYTVIVCDRYSAYKKLVRLLGGLITLAWCWSHQRRDFIECAAGQERLTQWCQEWIERIASIYRLNEARLKHYDPGLKRQTPAFAAAQTALEEALGVLFAHASTELTALPDQAREGKALRSLVNHREGLSVFVDRSEVPMDNNTAERILRAPSIGRRLSFGSNSEKGAAYTAIMYSVVGTLKMNRIDVQRWLQAWLTVCAKNGGKPPDDLSPWLPWSMSEERRRSFTAPG